MMSSGSVFYFQKKESLLCFSGNAGGKREGYLYPALCSALGASFNGRFGQRNARRSPSPLLLWRYGEPPAAMLC
ncbi:hypothetical protein [Cronobacter malonaticus]|uniref:hypothetical protein n=1 Tax=Cronobacter malonaticus TaxID=413503 RepID=UPI0013153396|nr:hypothetical protein [Cronobacter malonaticus]